jgi:hypothetical protein
VVSRIHVEDLARPRARRERRVKDYRAHALARLGARSAAERVSLFRKIEG